MVTDSQMTTDATPARSGSTTWMSRRALLLASPSTAPTANGSSLKRASEVSTVPQAGVGSTRRTLRKPSTSSTASFTTRCLAEVPRPPLARFQHGPRTSEGLTRYRCCTSRTDAVVRSAGHLPVESATHHGASLSLLHFKISSDSPAPMHARHTMPSLHVAQVLCRRSVSTLTSLHVLGLNEPCCLLSNPPYPSITTTKH